MKQQFISESCSWFHTILNRDKVLELQKLSGMGINRLGVFSDCVVSPHLKYFLMEYQFNTLHDGVFYTGICYSANCTQTDLVYITRSFNSYLPVPFNNLNIMQVPQPEIDWPFSLILVVSLLFVFFLISLVSTILYKSPKFKNTYFQALSYTHSFKLISQRYSSSERIMIIVGLRAGAEILMSIWNTCSILLKTPSYINELHNTHSFLSIFFFSFDFWLMVSGFYWAFELARNWDKIHSSKLVWFLLLRKTLKIFVVNLIVIALMHLVLLPMGSGPLWTLLIRENNNNCKLNIAEILMVSNLVDYSGTNCDYWLWIWYVEIQLAVLGCFLFLLLKSSYRYRVHLYIFIQILLFGLGFIAVNFWMDDVRIWEGALQGNISKLPFVRGGAYFVGYNLGYWYFKFRPYKNKERLFLIKKFHNQAIRVLVPFTGFAIMAMGYIFCAHWHEQIPFQASKQIVQCLHTLLPIGMMLLLSSELLGFKGPVYALLQGGVMNLISRLSFSGYAMQYMVAVFLIYSRTEDIYLNMAKVISYCSCTMITSLVLGFLFCLGFEMPIHKLIAPYFKGDPNKYIEFH